MTRQQKRAQERAEAKLLKRGAALRKTNPLAEDVHRQGYEEGWQAACNFAMKVCYAASVLALHELEGYGRKRNARFLRAMDSIVVNAITSEEVIDEAFEKAGVKINFREVFTEDRIQEVET